jgi:ABC-type phosphate transport system substrate-binding protein
MGAGGRVHCPAPDLQPEKRMPVLRRALVLLAVVFAAVALSPLRLSARDTSIAVIVNPGNSIESISLSQLRSIFLGTQLFWKDGTQIVPVVRAPSARERDVLLRRVVHMTDLQYQQYWRKRRLARTPGHEPIAVVSNGMQMQTVGLQPGAIALVATSDIHDGVKILKVGGHLPGSAAYPLKTSAVR